MMHHHLFYGASTVIQVSRNILDRLEFTAEVLKGLVQDEAAAQLSLAPSHNNSADDATSKSHLTVMYTRDLGNVLHVRHLEL